MANVVRMTTIAAGMVVVTGALIIATVRVLLG